jgi:GMC oxidoreductase
MGSARMGRDPKTSVLNAHNQLWDAKNVFVTDGACMLSSACQNPSRTGRGFRGERNEERKYLIFSGLGFYSTPTGIY